MQKNENKFEVIASKSEVNDFHQPAHWKKPIKKCYLVSGADFNFHHKSLLASQRWLATQSLCRAEWDHFIT